MTEKPYVGIHASVYVPRADFDAIRRDMSRAAIIAASGIDVLSPLERLALQVLRVAGTTPA